MSCDIKPTGLPKINFVFDELKIEAKPGGKCSDALVKKSFIKIPEVPFNKLGSYMAIGTDYRFFFNHLYEKVCPLKECSLR